MTKNTKETDRANAELVTAIIAYALGLSPASITETHRGTPQISAARQLAMYLTYTAFEMSLARCAYAFGRDRSTVAHACHMIETRRDDKAFDEWVDGLAENLRALAAQGPSQKRAA